MDPNTIALIFGAIVAAVFAYLAREDGKRVGERKGEVTGRNKAVQEIGAATAGHTLEKVNEANDAGAAVERRTPERVRDAARSRTPERVRDAARSDPNNLGRVQRP